MDLGSVLTRNTDAAYRIYDGQATVVLPGRAEVKVINAPGSLIWDQLDGVSERIDGADPVQQFARFLHAPQWVKRGREKIHRKDYKVHDPGEIFQLPDPG